MFVLVQAVAAAVKESRAEASDARKTAGMLEDKATALHSQVHEHELVRARAG